MKSRYKLMSSILISIVILSLAMAVGFNNQTKTVLAAQVNPDISPNQVCCQAGIAENACKPGTGNEMESFTTQDECDFWANSLRVNGYTCNPGEGVIGYEDNGDPIPIPGCQREGSSVRCFGGISQSIVNQSACGAQAAPTPTPYAPAPTPTPVFYYNPTPTPYYPPVYPTTPPYFSYNPTCTMTATAYGSSVTAYMYAQNAQSPVTYYFNFNDGSGDLSSSSSSMAHVYSILGYYSVTGYVTDGSGRSSLRCSSQQIYVPGTNIYPTPPIFYPIPTPVPINPVVIQPQNPIRVIVNGGNAIATANANANNANNPVFTTAAVQTKTTVSQLPRTGLPESAWLLSGLLPLGAGLRRFGKGFKAEGSLARFFWQKREFDKE